MTLCESIMPKKSVATNDTTVNDQGALVFLN